MDFYNQTLASNPSPHAWERDEEGIWERSEDNPAPGLESSRTSGTTLSSYISLFETQAAFSRFDLRDNTDATPLTSIAAEHDQEADQGRDRSMSPGTDECDSGRATPQQQPFSMDQTLACIDGAHLNERQSRRRSTRLDETSDEYGQTFVRHRRKKAIDRIRAAENGNAPPSRPYQIAVLRHDDLCPSNGPERINEERAAVCAHINKSTHAGSNCTICYRPPDYYQTSGHRAVTREESNMPAAEVEWRHRSRSGEAAAERPM